MKINVLPGQRPADVIEWVNKFFTFYHANLEAQVTAVDTSEYTATPSMADLLGEDVPAELSDDELALLVGTEDVESDLLK